MLRTACNTQEVVNIFQRSKKPKPTFINVGAFGLWVTTLQRKGGETNGENCK